MPAIPLAIKQQIIHLYQQGHQYSEISRQIPTPLLSRQAIEVVVKGWKKTGSLQRKQGSGRPKTGRSKENRRKVQRIVTREPNTSMRQVAKRTGLKRSSVRNIIRKDLGLKSFALKPCQNLTTQNKADRVTRGKILQREAKRVGWDFVLYLDEKRFTCQQAYNKRNSRVLAATGSGARASPAGKILKSQKPAGLMVWAGVSSHSRTDLIFFEDSVRMDSQLYIDKVLRPQVLNAGQVLFGNHPWLFTQDGAAPHTSNLTQQWLQTNGVPFLDKHGWPPRSPDCNPLDFTVWNWLETKACATPAPSVAALKFRLKKAWREMPQDVLLNACRAMPKRVKAMLAKKGDHFES